MLRRLILVITVAFLAVPSKADPGPVVNYLMNEPVSELSFGLYKLHLRLQTLENEYPATFFAFYDWDENRILLLANTIETLENTEENCTEIMSAIRTLASVNANTGEISGSFDSSSFAFLFGPTAYENSSSPDNWRERLDQIFVIKVGIFYNGEWMRCEGRLVSREVLMDLAGQ